MTGNYVPRCPMGFAGPRPPGHPPVGGGPVGGGGGEAVPPAATTAAAAAAASSTPTTWTWSDWQQWDTNALLVLDALFLVLCVTLAWYLPDLKRRWAAGAGAGGKDSGEKEKKGGVVEKGGVVKKEEVPSAEDSGADAKSRAASLTAEATPQPPTTER